MASKYVALFLWPMPKRNVAKYRAFARRAGRIFRKLGAVEYREFVGSDLKSPTGMASFARLVRKRPQDTVLFAVVGYRSKAHCHQVTRRIEAYAWGADMELVTRLLDRRKMVYGEFASIVEV